MGPSYANLFVGYIENKFFSNYQGPKADLYKRYLYIDDCVGATSSSREELYLLPRSTPFTRAKIHLGNFWKFISFPRDENFLSTTMVYLLAYTANRPILITICCIRPLIHNT